MKNGAFYSFVFSALVLVSSCSSPENKNIKPDIARADSLLNTVLALYGEDKYGLLTETYPVNPRNQVTYLADNGESQQKGQEVSYLWPYSGILSGVVSLYKTTGDEMYKELMQTRIIPGLELYWDSVRTPNCYQSYPTFNGDSDRFYDDNDWIAIDFCDYYALTGDEKFLDRAVALHSYIYSGWSDDMGGGIFWCEQKKESKNTCSNAPATVLCMKLYSLTNDNVYLDMAKKTYQWTKDNLCDTTDFVYWDNVNLNGNIATQKYTYNSGQMIQAAVLLYEETEDESYLTDAQKTAEGVYKHFLKNKPTVTGEMAFFPDMPWFNVILFRGLKELYNVDGNDKYIRAMKDNADYAWKHTRDEKGLLNADWSGNKRNKYKWLLDNASMVELYSELSEIDFSQPSASLAQDTIF